MAAKAKKTSSARGLQSMTGFGKASLENFIVGVDVEVKSVNSRFLDPVIKLPREYSALEGQVRTILQSEIHRGRVEVTASRSPKSETACAVEFNQALFDRLHGIYTNQLRSHGQLDAAAETRIICEILARREVLQPIEGVKDLDSESALLLSCTKKALEGLKAMRRSEGGRLESDIRGRASALNSLVDSIAKEAKTAAKNMGKELASRLNTAAKGVKLDPARLEQEILIAVERMDVTEELVRLKSHMTELVSAFSETPAGRKIDFILQECGRELNTIGSKAQRAKIQSLVVNAKVELEKIREQAQNVE